MMNNGHKIISLDAASPKKYGEIFPKIKESFSWENKRFWAKRIWGGFSKWKD